MSVILLMIFAIVSGICMMLLGPLMMAGRSEAFLVLLVLVTQLFPLRSVAGFAAVSHHKKRITGTALALLGIELVAILAVCLVPYFSMELFILLLEVYLSFIVVVNAIDTFLYGSQKQWPYFVSALVAWVVGANLFQLILFGSEEMKKKAIFFACGMLLMVFGAGQLCDFITLVTRNRKVKGVLSSIRLALPDITGILVPLRTAELLPEEVLCPSDRDRKGEIEVLFQFSSTGIALAGHCELCVDGKTYTYGTYDPTTGRFLGTMGDGIIIRAPRDKYLAYCMKTAGRKVISYTLSLNEAQEKALREQLALLEECFEPWEPQLPPKAFASRMQKLGGVEFYRITKGRYRTYFIPTINCVSLTDHLLEHAGIGHALIMGIKMPGAYMDHLERLYLTEKGVIAARRVYTEAE